MPSYRLGGGQCLSTAGGWRTMLDVFQAWLLLRRYSLSQSCRCVDVTWYHDLKFSLGESECELSLHCHIHVLVGDRCIIY